MTQKIKVFAPATVANVTCGFDVLGFAVDQPGDEVIVQLSNTPGVKIVRITGDDARLPLEANRNTVGAAILNMLEFLQSKQGIEITLHKKMPLGSGMGSSAASAAAGVVALNALLGTKLTNQQLVEFAMEGERVACGSAHADNAAPAIFGGFTLVRSYTPLDIINIPTPNDLYCSIVHPHIEVSTKDARMILKPMIKLNDAIIQCGNLGGLITGLITGNYALIGRSMQDVIIEPTRSILIPGYYTVKQSAIEAKALGVGISGSGPSLFALSETAKIAHNVGKAMSQAFSDINIGSDIYVSKINTDGVKIIG